MLFIQVVAKLEAKMFGNRIVLFVFIFVCHLSCPAFANNSSEKLNPAEIYAAEQVEKGETATLGVFPVEDRILRADFLRNLVSGSL